MGLLPCVRSIPHNVAACVDIVGCPKTPMVEMKVLQHWSVGRSTDEHNYLLRRCPAGLRELSLQSGAMRSSCRRCLPCCSNALAVVRVWAVAEKTGATSFARFL